MNIATAITQLNTNIGSVFHVDGTWKAKDHDENPVSFDLDAATKYAEEQTAKETHIYPRKMAYPTLEEQLDYIYHNGIDKWKTDIVDPIKQKYPKPE